MNAAVHPVPAARWRPTPLVAGSIALHRNLGFSIVGTLPSVGFKFQRWVDSVLMQRPLGDGDRNEP